MNIAIVVAEFNEKITSRMYDVAIKKAGENISNNILCSDAFFPFRDSIDKIANTGIKAVIQPGGSMRDNEVISACNEHQIAMVFTGKRCFKH